MEFCKPLFDRTSFYRELNAKLHNRQIVYLGAHAGWGKTIAAQEWIREYGNALLISAPMLRDFPKSQKKPSVLVIDDLQELSDAELQRDLLPLLAEAPQNQFVLIGRAELPSPLCLLQRAGQLAVLDQNALCLSRDVIDTYLAQTGLPYSVETSDYLMKESKGYPVAVDCLAELLRDGASCTEQTAQTAAQEIFRYFEHAVFLRLSREAQAFLLNIAQFHAFTLRMASTLNGDHEVVRILEEITHRGKCVFLRSPEHYGVPPLFHRFLIHCQKRMLSGEAIDNLWRRAGLYYEMSDEIPNALACYRQVNDWDKVMEILIRHTRRPPYTTFYFELKEFYLALPPALIERYPELMCSLSMIYSMNMQEKESEFWYDRLVCFSRSAGINESERKTAQERLAFLRIGLPHRGSRKIAQTIMDVIRLIHNEDRCVQGVSPTSGIPSLMHGAKDFCNWSKRNEQLYRLMKRPIELLLGKAGVGVADAGLAESKLECCTPQNITDVMRYATSAINQTEQSGTLDVYFAAVASMIRLAVMRGNVASAHKNLDCVEKKAQAEGNVRLLQNVRAFRTRIFLWEGKTAEVDRWMQEAAPDELGEFQLLNRYQYLVKARCYILKGAEMEAVSLLLRMMPYFEMSEHRYCLMEARMLLAIAQYRTEQEDWKTPLTLALDGLEHFGFLRLPAEEGAAILPLLTAVRKELPDTFCPLIIREASRYAKLYPLYLQPPNLPTKSLTQTEKQVLHLVVQGMNNAEIAQSMHI